MHKALGSVLSAIFKIEHGSAHLLSCTWEVETGGLEVQDQPGIHGTPSQNVYVTF